MTETPERIIVIAGTRQQANAWIRYQGLNPHGCVYPEHPHDSRLSGLRHPRYVVIGTAEQRIDFREIIYRLHYYDGLNITMLFPVWGELTFEDDVYDQFGSVLPVTSRQQIEARMNKRREAREALVRDREQYQMNQRFVNSTGRIMRSFDTDDK